MPELYLAPVSWFSGKDLDNPNYEPPHWGSPKDAQGFPYPWKDLRSNTQKGLRGPGTDGYGLMVLPQQVPNYGYYLGDNLNAVLTDVRKDEIRRALKLGERIVATNVREFIVEMFTRQGDPTGIDRVKPVRGARRKKTQIAIGKDVIWESPLDNILRDNAIAIFRADYRRNRALVAQGLMSLDAIRRWTGSMRRRLGIRAEELLPPEYSSDGELAPRSTVSDNFNRGDESLDVGNWDEVAQDWLVVSNEASCAASGASARYKTELSSDDHYCQHKASSYSSNAKWFRRYRLPCFCPVAGHDQRGLFL
ncbi:hypothetical protein LCGC14_2031490 [marine sediment metagenome]|uniref:Uncharacterized protein n=1 Tax=marine sediment metagenome TaxID=412755 RepID=A0A0F9H823_9ZZZZ